MCVCICVCVYVCVCMCTCVYIYKYMCACVCMCVCILLVHLFPIRRSVVFVCDIDLLQNGFSQHRLVVGFAVDPADPNMYQNNRQNYTQLY
jgi:hypothetical protein